MKCNHCQDTGLVIKLAEGYHDPVFTDAHVRTALPHYGNNPLVMDCECHYDNPLDNDQVLDTVMNWLKGYPNGIYPLED